NPLLLVEAMAAGVDLQSVLSPSYSAVPYYRFDALITRALEFAAYVAELGSGLLAALEKRDAVALDLLRADQEVKLLQQIRASKEKAIDAAQDDQSAAEQAKAVTQTKLRHYQALQFISAAEQSQLTSLGSQADQLLGAQKLETSANTAFMVPDFENGGAGF